MILHKMSVCQFHIWNSTFRLENSNPELWSNPWISMWSVHVCSYKVTFYCQHKPENTWQICSSCWWLPDDLACKLYKVFLAGWQTHTCDAMPESRCSRARVLESKCRSFIFSRDSICSHRYDNGRTSNTSPKQARSSIYICMSSIWTTWRIWRLRPKRCLRDVFYKKHLMIIWWPTGGLTSKRCTPHAAHRSLAVQIGHNNRTRCIATAAARMYTDLLYEHLQTRAQSRNSIFTYTSWEDNFHDTCFSKRPRDSAVDGIYFRKHDAASYQPAVARLGRFIQTNL